MSLPARVKRIVLNCDAEGNPAELLIVGFDPEGDNLRATAQDIRDLGGAFANPRVLAQWLLDRQANPVQPVPDVLVQPEEIPHDSTPEETAAMEAAINAVFAAQDAAETARRTTEPPGFTEEELEKMAEEAP